MNEGLHKTGRPRGDQISHHHRCHEKAKYKKQGREGEREEKHTLTFLCAKVLDHLVCS